MLLALPSTKAKNNHWLKLSLHNHLQTKQHVNTNNCEYTDKPLNTSACDLWMPRSMKRIMFNFSVVGMHFQKESGRCFMAFQIKFALSMTQLPTFTGYYGRLTRVKSIHRVGQKKVVT